MIVRILGEDQFSVDDAAVAELNQLDTDLETAIERGDEAGFTAALTRLLGHVRAAGSPLPPDTLEPSDLILPREDSSMDEVRQMLTDEGLIPGSFPGWAPSRDDRPGRWSRGRRCPGNPGQTCGQRSAQVQHRWDTVQAR